MFHTFEVFFRIDGTYLDVLGGLPVFYDSIVFNPLGTILSLETVYA